MGFLVIDSPFILTSPEVGDIIPATIFIVVVFPAPFVPRRPNISPFFTSKLIPFKASKP